MCFAKHLLRIKAQRETWIVSELHKSEAYQKALQALGSGAERDYRIVEGV